MAKVIRCHKIRLRPNKAQEQFFLQCVGTARFAYNHALEQWQRQYAEGGKPNQLLLRRQLNAEKREQFPWMLDVPKSVVQQAVKNLGSAYTNFFKKRGKFPKFKSRHDARQSARLDNGAGTFEFDENFVRLPKIGWVKMFEKLRFTGRPISCVLRKEAGRWFLSVAVEIEEPQRVENQDLPWVGIDFGVSSAVTLSTGEKLASPAPLKQALNKLVRLQRQLARKVKGSKNRAKAKVKVARLHWRIKQVRYDWQHKLSTMLARRFGGVCMEDLNVKGMMSNHCLARSISDIGWSELARQLDYKTAVMRVSRWYPSSKTCSCCGHVVASLPLDVRSWTCEKCDAVHDRDENAAKNILAEGLRISTASCAGINACGDGGSDDAQGGIVKPPSTKQESRMYHLIQK